MKNIRVGKYINDLNIIKADFYLIMSIILSLIYKIIRIN